MGRISSLIPHYRVVFVFCIFFASYVTSQSPMSPCLVFPLDPPLEIMQYLFSFSIKVGRNTAYDTGGSAGSCSYGALRGIYCGVLRIFSYLIKGTMGPGYLEVAALSEQFYNGASMCGVCFQGMPSSFSVSFLNVLIENYVDMQLRDPRLRCASWLQIYVQYREMYVFLLLFRRWRVS